jgi:RNA polymerase II subunit A small phosphatase-like protein
MKLIVLDIDGTLIDSTTQTEFLKYKDLINQGPDARFEDYYMFKRGFLMEFLEYLFIHYKVAIWTAAQKIWADTFLSTIPYYKDKFEFVWARDKCNIKQSEDGSTIYYKPLRKIWRSQYGRKNDINKTNTIILEDTPINCSFNYGNAIYISSYLWTSYTDDKLNKIIDYLIMLNTHHKMHNTIRNVDKRDWYRKLICPTETLLNIPKIKGNLEIKNQTVVDILVFLEGSKVNEIPSAIDSSIFDEIYNMK